MDPQNPMDPKSPILIVKGPYLCRSIYTLSALGFLKKGLRAYFVAFRCARIPGMHETMFGGIRYPDICTAIVLLESPWIVLGLGSAVSSIRAPEALSVCWRTKGRVDIRKLRSVM